MKIKNYILPMLLMVCVLCIAAGCVTGEDGQTRVDPYLTPKVQPDGTAGTSPALQDLQEALDATNAQIAELKAAYDRRGESLIEVLKELETLKAAATTQPATPDNAAILVKFEQQIDKLNQQIAATEEAGDKITGSLEKKAAQFEALLEQAKAVSAQVITPQGQIDPTGTAAAVTGIAAVIPGAQPFLPAIGLVTTLLAGLWAANERRAKTKQTNELAIAIKKTLGTDIPLNHKTTLLTEFSDPTLTALQAKGVKLWDD